MGKQNSDFDDLAKHIMWGMAQDNKKDTLGGNLYRLYQDLVDGGFNDNQAIYLLGQILGALTSRKD